MTTQHDGIVIGAGHNGLILQAYLCRAGLRVASVERAERPGGPLVTEPDPSVPGVLHNPHAVFLRGVRTMPWFTDLELGRHRVDMIQPELNFVQIAGSGQCLRIFLDPARTWASIAELSKPDAETYRRIAEEFTPVLDHVIAVEAAAPPLESSLRRDLLSRSRVGRLALETEPLSPREFVDRHFESPMLKAGLLYVCIIREVDIHAPGQGLLVPAIIASREKAQLCRGGSAVLAQGLAADVTEHGGEVFSNCEVRSIVLAQGRAAGVILADGTRLGARHFVASTLNPHQTFLGLIDRASIPDGIARSAHAYRYNVVGPLFGVNVALRERPRYAIERRFPEVGTAGLTILGLDRPDEIYALYEGRLPELASVWGTCPTVHDPSQAPSGLHAAFMWQKVPYRLNGDPLNWDSHKAGHARAILERWRTFAPNMGPGNILSQRALSPLDTERRFPNLAGGDLGVGWMGPGQARDERPFPGFGRYRGPLPNLYLAGGATHPGGNITGLPGYIAARIILEDLGVKPWWSSPEPEAIWASLP